MTVREMQDALNAYPPDTLVTVRDSGMMDSFPTLDVRLKLTKMAEVKSVDSSFFTDSPEDHAPEYILRVFDAVMIDCEE